MGARPRQRPSYRAGDDSEKWWICKVGPVWRVHRPSRATGWARSSWEFCSGSDALAAFAAGAQHEVANG